MPSSRFASLSLPLIPRSRSISRATNSCMRLRDVLPLSHGLTQNSRPCSIYPISIDFLGCTHGRRLVLHLRQASCYHEAPITLSIGHRGDRSGDGKPKPRSCGQSTWRANTFRSLRSKMVQKIALSRSCRKHWCAIRSGRRKLCRERGSRHIWLLASESERR